MNRRRGSLGWIVAGLGLLLCICLLPYLISSVYSVASTLLQVPTTTRWLWGDWLSMGIAPGTPEYRLVVEAPVCCSGALGLLTAVLGLVWLASGREGQEPEAEGGEEVGRVSIPGEDLPPEPEPCALPEATELAEEAGQAVEPVELEIDRATW